MSKPDDAKALAERSSQGRSPLRKAYQSPRLTVYGDIPQITQAMSSGPIGDGGAHPNNKT